MSIPCRTVYTLEPPELKLRGLLAESVAPPKLKESSNMVIT